MAPSGADTKILRIGVIQGGKVIEERLVRKRATVTVGTDNKNTFVLAGSEMPKSWPLFELKGAQYHLVFSEDMKGRVSVDKNDVDFASLRAQNFATKQGNSYRLALNDSSRGRVQLGNDLTILFHFVVAPPVAAKPELPESAKGGWVKSIEPIFTSVLAASFVIHSGMAFWVSTVDPPPPPSKEEVLRAIAKLQPPKIEQPPPEVPDTRKKSDSDNKKAASKKDDKPAEVKEAKVEKAASKPQTAAAAKAAAARRAEVRSQVASKGLLAMIGATAGTDSDSAVGNVFGSGNAIGGDLQNALAGTAGVGVAGSGGDITRRGGGGGGGGSGGAADIGTVSAGGGGAVETARKGPAQVKSRVKADDISSLDGKIDKKGVASTIRRRQSAFQQCYESALKSDSKLSGKLVVEFVIDEDGRVKEASVVNDGLGSTDVSKCVISTLRRLRFPRPDDGEVTITNSFVFQPGG